MIVLDTHAWVWWVAEPAKLSVRARAAIDRSDALGVCAISCWEVAMLVAKQRLRLDRDTLLWIRQALALARLELLALTPEVAVASSRLSGDFPGDPADRLIVAAALENRAEFVSKDARLRGWGGLTTIW